LPMCVSARPPTTRDRLHATTCHAPDNFAVLRHIARDIMQKDPTKENLAGPGQAKPTAGAINHAVNNTITAGRSVSNVDQV
jgi:hypothetical protein